MRVHPPPLCVRLLLLGALAIGPGTPIASAQPRAATRVAGAVFDSLRGRPLADALVQLVPAAQITQGVSVRTDAAGAFAFDGVPQGTYLVGFTHPSLDSLALELPPATINVADAPVESVALFVPTARDLRRRICGAGAPEAGGVVFVLVRAALDGAPLGDARVAIRWREVVVREASVQYVPAGVRGETGPEGVLALCGVPTGVALELVGAHRQDSTGVLQVTVPGDGIARREIFIGASTPRPLVAVTTADAAPLDASRVPTVRRGSGRFRGTVRREDGSVVAGARVAVLGTGAATVSTADGRFSLDSLPLGTWPLIARFIGFRPTVVAVDVLAARENAGDVWLEPLDFTLDTVKVFAVRPLAAIMAPFEKRRKEGWGRFLTEGQIAARHFVRLSDLFRGMAGVRITPGPMGDIILMDLGGHEYCVPNLVVDGVGTWSQDGVLEGVVSVTEVRGVEVYVRNPPPEFGGLAGCGAIALWTGRAPVRGVRP